MVELLESTLRLSTPLIFAAIGGLFCERSGIATICLEGVMLNSAWTAAVVNYFTHDPYLATLAALAVGAVTMGLHAILCIYVKSDHIISGVAVNMLSSGLTPLLTKALFTSPTNTPNIPMADRFSVLPVPGLSQIPVIGKVFFQSYLLVYIALLLPLFVHFFLYRTRFGLRLIAAGDGPKALEAAGVSKQTVRLKSLLLGGALTSLGGTFLSIIHGSEFTRDMTAGRGYIALTALIFGKWKPIPAFFACLLFGFTDALQITLQSSSGEASLIPVQLIQALPYLATLVVLAGFIGRSRPPLAIGDNT